MQLATVVALIFIVEGKLSDLSAWDGIVRTRLHMAEKRMLAFRAGLLVALMVVVGRL